MKNLYRGALYLIVALVVFADVGLGSAGAAVNSATVIHSEIPSKHSRHIFGFPENTLTLEPKILECSTEIYEKISSTHFVSKSVMTLLNPGSRAASLVVLEYAMIGTRRRDIPVLAPPSRATVHELRAGELRRVAIIDELDGQGMQAVGMTCRVAEAHWGGKARRRR